VKVIGRHKETGNVAYLLGNSVARSSNHCCSGNATIYPRVLLRYTVICLKIWVLHKKLTSPKKTVSRN